MKLLIRIAVAAVLLVLIAASAVYVYFIRVTGDDGSSALEVWIGEQIRAAAGSHLNVDLQFESPDYQYPYTVVVQKVRLTAPDPAGEGGTLDIISIGKATLTLGEIPAIGKPLHIENVVLESPRFNFVCKSATDAGLIGFSNLIKTADEPGAVPDPALPPAKVTDVFRIRMVHMTNGQFHFDPRNPDKRAMHLDRVNLGLNVEPDKEGWYTLKTRMDRAPIGALDIDGRFNLNDNVLDLSHLRLTLNLGGDNNNTLPPQMQAFLAEHDVRGELTVEAAGSIRLADWRNANLEVKANLGEGRFSFGQYRLNVPQLSLMAAMKDQMLSITQLDARTLGGTLMGNAQLALNDAFDAQLRLEGEDLRIHQVLKAAETPAPGGKPASDEELPFRGIANFKVHARAPLTSLTTRLLGGGNLTLREARLVALPGVTLLEDELAAKKSSDKRNPGASDTVFLLFTFKNDRIRVDNLDYRSTVIAARGKGEVLLDGLKLDLKISGGPLEKVQSLLGPIGDLTTVVTDRIARYQLTGTVASPKIKAIIADGVFDKLFK